MRQRLEILDLRQRTFYSLARVEFYLCPFHPTPIGDE